MARSRTPSGGSAGVAAVLPKPTSVARTIADLPSGAAAHWELGRAARKEVPRSRLGTWQPSPERPSPVDTLVGQETDRVPDLIPLRHERMSASPFAFYRGSAALMAHDLGSGPSTGLIAQLAGDAHLANFGGFAASDRTLIFDLNDFDETLPGPFEWDLKRLAASFEIAGLHQGFTQSQREQLVGLVVSTYRDAMGSFSRVTRMDVWYARIQADDIVSRWGHGLDPKRVAAFQKRIAAGRSKTNAKAVSRYTEVGPDGQLRITSQPPVLVPVSELAGVQEAEVREFAQGVMASYQTTLDDDRALLLRGYHAVDAARKVVGVGSVGTRCWITLLVATDDENDDLVLQVKQAGPSVLEGPLGASRYQNHGQRVVEGQRLMQASSDILLGWTRFTGRDGVARDYYLRQMWDWKTSADLESMDHLAYAVYARMCGWTLARAHARSGDRHAIAAYIGSGRSFGRAMVQFAASYAEQNQRDYDEFLAAIRSGRITSSAGEGPGGDDPDDGSVQ